MFVITFKCEIYKGALLIVIRLTRLWYMAIQSLFQLSNFSIQVSFIHCIFWTQPVQIIVKWPDQTVILFSCLPGNSCWWSMMFSWLACASFKQWAQQSSATLYSSWQSAVQLLSPQYLSNNIWILGLLCTILYLLAEFIVKYSGGWCGFSDNKLV